MDRMLYVRWTLEMAASVARGKRKGEYSRPVMVLTMTMGRTRQTGRGEGMQGDHGGGGCMAGGAGCMAVGGGAMEKASGKHANPDRGGHLSTANASGR